MKRFFASALVAMICCFSLVSQAGPTIRFGMIYFYPPFAFSTKTGFIYGLDVDIAKSVCQQIKAQCTFTAMPLNELFSQLAQHKVDAIMGAISITPERLTRFDFTKPYFKSTMSYVTLATTLIDPTQLPGKKVGVVKDSTFYQYLLNKYGNSIKIYSYMTNEALAMALSKKEINIILLDTPAASYWVGYSTGLFKIVGTPEYLSFDRGYGIVVAKDNNQLLTELQKGLDMISSNGELAKLKQTYIKP